MTWSEPGWFVWGMCILCAIGALMPVRIDTREDHVMLTIVSAVGAAIFGPKSLIVLGAAVLVAAGLVIAWSYVRPDHPPDAIARGRRSAAWIGVSAIALTVGFVVGNLVYAVLLGRSYPVQLITTADVIGAGFMGTGAWIAMMSVRVLSQRWVSGPLIEHGLDPFDSAIVPYLFPTVAGCPIIIAALAIYNPAEPAATLLVLLWVFPLYFTTVFDLRRRRLAQELRRDAFAAQRLAAIGEVSARIVHQSRHQVGLMGWSIHRLRGLVGQGSTSDITAVQLELDALADAKDRLGEMLASELLHEKDPRADATDAARPEATYAEMIADIGRLLRAKAEGEGVAVATEVAPTAGAVLAPSRLHDVVFNLVDNAIDAATSRVVVQIEAVPASTLTSAGSLRAGPVPGGPIGGGPAAGADAALVIRVCDDGAGLAALDATRMFEPFSTTKADGTGMGLAIADALVGDLGGDLRYERSADTTTFTVTLPAP